MYIPTRLRWLFKSQEYKRKLVEDACLELGRGTCGFYLFSELLWKIQEGFPLDDADAIYMDIAQDLRDGRYHN